MEEDEPVPVENVAYIYNASLPPDGQFDVQDVLDPTLTFLDEPQAANLDFLDLLPYNYVDTTQLDPQVHQAHHQDGLANDTIYPFPLNGGVDLLSGISFEEEPDSTAAHMSKDMSDSLQRYWQSQNIEPLEPPESFSSDSSSSPESGHNTSTSSSRSAVEPSPTPKAVPSVACGCLSNLYLALDSLSRLPPDITGAMRVARHSTKVAHDVIKCRFCSEPLIDDPTAPPPIQCFQNLMCLAALVPSACNAYAAILEMVDNETQTAKQEGRSMFFSFKDVGGMWGAIGHHSDCPRMQTFDNKDMDPDMWRTTMRAILRLDVYGFGDPPSDVNSTAFKQQGLRDVVKLLEERSERRHSAMDRAAAHGQMPIKTQFLLQQTPYQSVPAEQRNCIRVLEAARIALDNLVIA